VLSLDCFTQDGEIDIVKIITKSGIAKSNSEARRLINQNALKINGERFNTFQISNSYNDFVIQVGKARFVKVKIEE
jgi:tyrosyl-tRNA synthetase